MSTRNAYGLCTKHREGAEKDRLRNSSRPRPTWKTTTAAKDKAEADLLAQTKRADKLNEDLTKTREERDTAQADLAAYKATGVTPQQILGMNQELKNLQDNLATANTENKILHAEDQEARDRACCLQGSDLLRGSAGGLEGQSPGG